MLWFAFQARRKSRENTTDTIQTTGILVGFLGQSIENGQHLTPVVEFYDGSNKVKSSTYRTTAWLKSEDIGKELPICYKKCSVFSETTYIIHLTDEQSQKERMSEIAIRFWATLITAFMFFGLAVLSAVIRLL